MQSRFRPREVARWQFVAAVLASVLGGRQATSQEWVTECIDCPRNFEFLADAIALDANGHPHVAYGDDGLYHAWFDGRAWHTEVVDETPLVGKLASLTFGTDGYPRISYAWRCVTLARKDSTGWRFETVERVRGGWHHPVAFDASDRPHILYNDQDSVRIAWHDGSVWRSEAAARGRGGRLALDHEGNPHIAYSLRANEHRQEAGYAYRDVAGWHVEQVDTGGRLGIGSLKLDNRGRPHISYCDWNEYHLKYAHKAGAGWQVDTVDWQCGAHSLDLDDLGYPHISYCGHHDPYGEASLEYAHKDASGWHTETIDEDGCRGEFPSNSIAVGGTPYVVYHGAWDSNLRCAHRDSRGWHVSIVDRGGSVYNPAPLTVDSRGRLHVSYALNGLKHAVRDASGWLSTTVDSARVGYCFPMHVLDEADHVRISYARRDTLVYTWQDEAGWHIENVAIVRALNARVSLAVDSGGWPHIAFSDATDHHLGYAAKDSTGWQTWEVDRTAYAGRENHIAITPNGTPHIAYLVRERLDRQLGDIVLMHAHRDGSHWHTESLGGERFLAPPVLFASDAAGYLHVVFWDRGYNAVKYALSGPAGWTVETVSAKTAACRPLGLAVDGDGRPHVACACDGRLTYAVRGTSGWERETVDPEEFWRAEPAAITVDAQRRPHISYVAAYRDGRGVLMKCAHREEDGWDVEIVLEDPHAASTFLSVALDDRGGRYVAYLSGNDLKCVHSSESPERE